MQTQRTVTVTMTATMDAYTTESVQNMKTGAKYMVIAIGTIMLIVAQTLDQTPTQMTSHALKKMECLKIPKIAQNTTDVVTVMPLAISVAQVSSN